MKSESSLFGIFWLTTLSLSLLTPGVFADVESRISFDPVSPSFGKIVDNNGRDRSLKVRLRNSTKERLSVLRIGIGCGCMEATLDGPTTLEPNGETSLVIRLRMRKLQRGAVKYNLTVADEKGIAGITTVDYTYEPRLYTAPSELVISEQRPDGALVGTALIHAQDDIDLHSLRVECSSAFVSAKVIPVHDTRNPLTLEVIASLPDLGPFEEYVSVFLRDSSEPAIVLPIRGVLAAPVVIRPTSILLNGSRAPVTRTVTLENAGPYILQEARSSSRHISVRPILNNSRTPIGLEVRVEQTAAGASDFVDERVTLVFDGPRKFEIDIPVIGETR